MAAVALRIAAAIYIGDQVGEQLPGVADQLSYHTLALRLLDGHGFTFAVGWWPATPAGEPTAHWSYLYTVLLSAVYAVAGPHPLAARLLQAVAVGVLHPYMTWRVAGRLAGPVPALAAAWVAAVYPYFAFYGAALMTEALYFVAILVTIDLALQLGANTHERPAESWRLWAWFGAAIGAAALLRQVYLLCVPLLCLWIAGRRSGARGAVGCPAPARRRSLVMGLAVAATVAALAIAPATVRNYRAFGLFVPLNTNAGFAFFWGNHPAHGSTFQPILPGDGSHYGRLIPDELRALNEAELDQALLRRGVRFVADDPARYLQLTAGRLREYLKFWPSADSGLASNVLRTGGFGLLLPLIVLGMVLVGPGTTPSRGRLADPGVAVLLLAVAAGYTIVHVLVWTLVRYRLPVDAALTPFAGVALAWLADRARVRGWLPGHAVPAS